MPLVWVVTVLTMVLNSTLRTVLGLDFFKPLTVFRAHFGCVFFSSKLRRQNAKFLNLVDHRDFHKKNILKSQKLTTKNSIYINTNSNQSFNSCYRSFSSNLQDPGTKSKIKRSGKIIFLKISNIKYYICAGISGLYKNYLTIKRSI